MPAFTDMLGREVVINTPPRRIVSLVPSQTELLYDLGLEEEVAGITKFCVHPERWFRSKARVGGTKQVHSSRVAALAPDLIIANKEENVKEQIEALSAIAPVWISDIHHLDEALQMIRAVGLITGRPEKAAGIADLIEAAFEELPRLPGQPRVCYGIWRNPWMWAGGDTFISDVIKKAGWQNALETVPRYPEVSPDALARYQPDVILLSSEPYPFKMRHVAELSAVLPQVKVKLVDGEMFSWYGSRLQHAAAYLKTLILDGDE